jgi:hypothetical protein
VYPLVSLKVAHQPSQVFDRFVTFLDQVQESELLITLSFDESGADHRGGGLLRESLEQRELVG